MKLDEIRNKIDCLDDKMAELYRERMFLSKLVGEEKNISGTPVENKIREKEILRRVTFDMEEALKLYTKQVFTTIFETSKAYQYSFTDIKSNLKDKILNIKEAKPFPVSASVACQGTAGAYSNIACDKLFPINTITYFKDFEGVFGAVEKSLCEFGILPIENSSAGSIGTVYDLMRKHNFYIARSIRLRVKHCLLASKGAKISDIKEIYSHEQAINQCSSFIKTLPNVKINVCSNTAIAAEITALSGRSDIACLSSEQCAELYGLEILKSNVQNNNNNYTRFIVISKNLSLYQGADKISIMVNLAHESGSLNKLLGKFAALNLNLTKIESRPIPDSVFEFCFYFDFEADICDKEVLNLLAELENTTENFVFLGSYSEVL